MWVIGQGYTLIALHQFQFPCESEHSAPISISLVSANNF